MESQSDITAFVNLTDFPDYLNRFDSLQKFNENLENIDCKIGPRIGEGKSSQVYSLHPRKDMILRITDINESHGNFDKPLEEWNENMLLAQKYPNIFTPILGYWHDGDMYGVIIAKRMDKMVFQDLESKEILKEHRSNLLEKLFIKILEIGALNLEIDSFGDNWMYDGDITDKESIQIRVVDFDIVKIRSRPMLTSWKLGMLQGPSNTCSVLILSNILSDSFVDLLPTPLKIDKISNIQLRYCYKFMEQYVRRNPTFPEDIEEMVDSI